MLAKKLYSIIDRRLLFETRLLIETGYNLNIYGIIKWVVPQGQAVLV